jgi:hypothetical protein
MATTMMMLVAEAEAEVAGEAVAKGETGAVVGDGPDYIWNRLEVSGPHERLYDFIGAASGPGFIDWRPEWHSVYEQICFGVVKSAPTRDAAEHLARNLRDILWRRHEDERARVDLDSHRVPLDLNTLIPIPRRILRKGFVEAGQAWMWANWGVRWPIRRVSFVIDRDPSGVRPLAVFRFLSEDWSPWIALLRMRERWPELSFKLTPSYLYSDLNRSSPVAEETKSRGRTAPR